MSIICVVKGYESSLGLAREELKLEKEEIRDFVTPSRKCRLCTFARASGSSSGLVKQMHMRSIVEEQMCNVILGASFEIEWWSEAVKVE